MKDPAVLFYTSDFIAGTITMTDAQRGQYILLLCLQHQKGHLTEKDMLKICNSYDEDIWCKFTQKDGIYYNERMKVEADKRRKYSESRASNRKKKDNDEQDEKDMKNISDSYDKHMENENEDINKDIDKEVSKDKETINYEAIKDYYNAKCKGMIKCTTMTKARKEAVNARIKEHGKDVVREIIDKAGMAPHLKGQNDRGWKADIGWLFNPENFVKVLEGKYDERKMKPEPRHPYPNINGLKGVAKTI